MQGSEWTILPRLYMKLTYSPRNRAFLCHIKVFSVVLILPFLIMCKQKGSQPFIGTKFVINYNEQDGQRDELTLKI